VEPVARVYNEVLELSEARILLQTLRLGRCRGTDERVYVIVVIDAVVQTVSDVRRLSVRAVRTRTGGVVDIRSLVRVVVAQECNAAIAVVVCETHKLTT